MISYTNPGLIPVDAIRLMGASVKEEGSFGRFGTGFKYAVATILRGGGRVTIWRGSQQLRFETREVYVKGQAFHEVWLHSMIGEVHDEQQWEAQPLGFTTALGRDWEPWMAHRELACNARDEGGDFAYVHLDDLQGVMFGQPDGPEETCILVDWDLLDEAVTQGQERVFVDEKAEVLLDERGVVVRPGPSDYLYHRGVRVWKLPKPSVFTYDITRPVELTEDRTVKYGFMVLSDVRNMILASTDDSIIVAATQAGKDTWEGTFDWAGTEWSPAEPGLRWLEVVAAGREINGRAVSSSARDVLLKHRAFSQVQRSTWSDMVGVNQALSDAAEALGEMGFDLEKVEVYVVDELPGGALSSVKSKSVYVTRQLLGLRRNRIVRELLGRFLEVEGRGDHDTLLACVQERFYDLSKERVYWLRRDEEMAQEEAKIEPGEAEAASEFGQVMY